MPAMLTRANRSVKSRNNEAEEDENANYFHIESSKEDDTGDESDSCSQCCGTEKTEEDEEENQRKAMRFVKDDKGEWHIVTKGEEEDKTMKVDALEQPADDEEERDKEPELEDEDYLIASPVVLGWAFTEKLWLEFPVATVEDIIWNEKAFDTLVLPEEQKAIVRALVESHSGSTSPKTIDDFITGKGRGLVCVLHG